MKRPLGILGLCYLVILAVVFYFYSSALIIITACAAVLLAAAGLTLRAVTGKKAFLYLVIISVSAITAATSLFFAENFGYAPIVDNYSNKEISFTGYICEEITLTEHSCGYIIQTDTIDGEKVSAKIALYAKSEFMLEEFDGARGTLRVEEYSSNKQKSRGIYLIAFEDDSLSLEPSGEKHFSPYSLAVAARKGMKQALDSSLPDQSAALCKAVLLGDKQALDSQTLSAFADTGTSHLIVVSGMHLSTLCYLALAVLKKLKPGKRTVSAVLIILVFMFCAVTGFTPSVARAGIMTAITYLGAVFSKNGDGINSLGIAALAIALPNPFSVGDAGLLLSAAATLGILLWAKQICGFISRKLRVFGIKRILPRRIALYLTGLFAVSLSASIWTMPLTVVFFRKISPLSVVISLLAEPLTCLVLVLSLGVILLRFLGILPVFHGLISLAADICCRCLSGWIMLFGNLPFSSVYADDAYFFVWIAVTAVLTAAGCVLAEKSGYIPAAIALSCLTLTIGFGLTELLDDGQTAITVFQGNSSFAAIIHSRHEASVLAGGGTSLLNSDSAQETFEKYNSLNNIIIPVGNFKYTNIYPWLDEKRYSRLILLGDSDGMNYDITQSALEYKGDFILNIKLTESASDRVISSGNAVYNYVETDSLTVLFIKGRDDIERLPAQYRSADVIVADIIPDNFSHLSCGRFIYTGAYNNRFKNNYEDIRKICTDYMTLQNETIELK